MKKKTKIELKYSLLAVSTIFILIFVIWLGEKICMVIPDGIIGLILFISYLLLCGFFLVTFLLFLLKKYYEEIEKYK